MNHVVMEPMIATDFIVDPTKYSLGGLYTDITDSKAKDTTVYANGNMQSRIYIAYSYNDDAIDDSDATVLAALDKYIKDNITFYYLDSSNNLVALSGWRLSASPNEFQHDLDNADPDLSTLEGLYGRRIPYYLIPPKGEYGIKYRFVAKLKGTDEQTAIDAPACVHTKEFSIATGDFDIRDVKNLHDGDNVLRSLCYKANGPNDIPDSHKPVRLEENKGVKVKCQLHRYYDTNSWIALSYNKWKKAGVFVEPNAEKVAVLTPGYRYYYESNGVDVGSDTVRGEGDPWNATLELNAADVHDGIAMCKLNHVHFYSEKHSLSFKMQDFVIVDNYGNRIHIDFDWDYGGNYYNDWAVSNTRVELP